MDYVVIMAGGSGQRLWPLSRRCRPKQVLRLFSGRTLLEECFDRLRPMFSLGQIYVLTNHRFVQQVRDLLPELPSTQILAEPEIRDTAAAIGLAATVLTRLDPDARFAVVTADHLIRPADRLLTRLADALGYVKQHPQTLCTFGVKPTFPATQYGYLHFGPAQTVPDTSAPVHRILAFKEKPSLDVARQYLSSGEYWWNSGMFVWSARTILGLLGRYVPEAKQPLEQIGTAWGRPDFQATLSDCFGRIPKISIDYAVMERADDVVALPLDCEWRDVGGFAALREVLAADATGNTVAASRVSALNTHNCILVSEQDNHLIATIGLENMLVVHSPDATLVCPVDQLDLLKKLLAEIESQGFGEML